eukprot:7767425-Alexandrium_andersonii.AAC.1
MSASLVGSEMCIRDRAATARAAAGAGDRASAWGAPRGRSGTPPQGWETCLLYTSDAADDM